MEWTTDGNETHCERMMWTAQQKTSYYQSSTVEGGACDKELPLPRIMNGLPSLTTSYCGWLKPRGREAGCSFVRSECLGPRGPESASKAHTTTQHNITSGRTQLRGRSRSPWPRCLTPRRRARGRSVPAQSTSEISEDSSVPLWLENENTAGRGGIGRIACLFSF